MTLSITAPPTTIHPRHGAFIGRKIVLVILLTVLVGLIYELMVTPLFYAYSLIQLDDHDRRVQHSIAAEIEIMRSHQVIGQVVDDLHLIIGSQPTTRPAAIAILRQRLEIVEQPPGSGIVEIGLQDPNPTRAAQVVNAIVNEYLHTDLESNIVHVNKLAGIMGQHTHSLKERLDISTTALDNFRLEHGITDPLQETQRLRAQITTVTNKIKQLQEKNAEVVSSFGLDHIMINALNMRQGQLIQEQESLQQRLVSIPAHWRESTNRVREVEINTQLYLAQLQRIQILKNWQQILLSNKNEKQLSSLKLLIPRVINPAVVPDSPVQHCCQQIDWSVLISWIIE